MMYVKNNEQYFVFGKMVEEEFRTKKRVGRSTAGRLVVDVPALIVHTGGVKPSSEDARNTRSAH